MVGPLADHMMIVREFLSIRQNYPRNEDTSPERMDFGFE